MVIIILSKQLNCNNSGHVKKIKTISKLCSVNPINHCSADDESLGDYHSPPVTTIYASWYLWDIWG